MTADKKSQNLLHSCINHDNTLTAKERKGQNNRLNTQNKISEAVMKFNPPNTIRKISVLH